MLESQWVSQGATRLHIVDLDGAKAGKPVNGPVIRQIVEAARVPCQLGGGIRTDADLAAVFDWGIQWAVLGTRALQPGGPVPPGHETRSVVPAWFASVAVRYAQRIVLGIDAKNGLVATDGWLAVSGVRAIDLAREASGLPLAAVVYTDIAKDGMMSGPNFEALAEMQASCSLPVIASGGVCTVDHVKRLAAAKTYGCIIGRALYEGTMDLQQVVASCGEI